MTTTRVLRRGIALILLATAFTACGDDGGKAEVPNLDGKWAVDSTTLEEPAKSAIDNTNRPNITFAGNTVSGFNGCNTFTGGVTYDSKKMEFTGLAQTLLACPDPAAQIETQFMALLNSVRFYDKSGTTLHLKDGDSKVVLTLGSV